MLLGEPARGGMLVYMSLIYIIGPFLDSFKFLGSMCYDAANIYIHKYLHSTQIHSPKQWPFLPVFHYIFVQLKQIIPLIAYCISVF